MSRGTEAALLVPTTRHVEIERSGRGPGAITARRFRDFEADAMARLAPELSFVGPHTTRPLTRRALDDLPEDRLPFPVEPAARIALACAVDRSIGRLRRAGTAAGHLRAAGGRDALILADVLERVDALLAGAGATDARSAASIVARRLQGGAAAELPELAAGRVVVAGTAAWEPGELAVLEALHERVRGAGGAGLSVELPRLTGPLAQAPDDAIAPVAEELERRWGSLNDPPDLSFSPAQRGLPRAVIVARDVDGEARAIAARVLAALAEGTPPERIALVVPDLDEARLEPFRAALGDAGIPFAEPRGRPVASCPEGRVALALLAVAVGPVTREQIIELLRAPGLSASFWVERAHPGEATARAALLAHRLREVPVDIDRTGRLLVDGLTAAVRGRPEEGWMPRALDRVLASARWIGEATDAGSGASRREMARRLLTLLDRLSLGHPSQRELAAALKVDGRGAGRLALRALGEGAAAVRAIREAVRSLVIGAAAAGLADAPSTPADLAAELGVAASELGIGLGASGGAAGAGAVRIGRPAELAGLPHDLVLVTGLVDRAYAGAEGDDALLDERLRRRLPVACRPPSSAQREASCRAELAWAISGADRVDLSYGASDGRELASPHRLVRWAEALSVPFVAEPASRVALRASRLDARGAELCALAAGAAPGGDVEARRDVERARTAFFLDPGERGGRFTGRVILGDEPARRRLVAAVGGDAPARSIAVTAVERAAGCAFAGFARRVLRARRVDDLAESADARERGTLVHRALAAAFEGARDAAPGESPLAAARANAERSLGVSASMAPLRREAVAQAVHDALGVVARSLEGGDALRFLVAEQGFNRTAAWAPLSIGGDEEGAPVLYVDGQIDRVDVSPDGKRARVVDYKTGRVPAADEHGKTAFQLPLYAAVVAQALGAAEVEALYVSVRARGVVDEWPRAEAERRALGGDRGEIAAAARRVVLALWAGEVAPRPAKPTMCTRCEARDVCRRPAVTPFEEADPR